jgi:hypothetical protein
MTFFIQGVVEEALAEAGYQTAIAATGERAMDQLLASNRNFRAL